VIVSRLVRNGLFLRITRLVACVIGVLLASWPWTVRAQGQEPVLRWGGDEEGGAPFVQADPRDPSKHVGFDVDIAELIAHDLGRRPQFVQLQFQSLDQSAVRGDFAIGLSGIEDTPARRRTVPTSIPYYEFREVLTVRDADRDRFRSLADLAGHPVGTLSGTIAADILTRSTGIVARPYEDDVHPYSDLALGRLDGVLLDRLLADRALAHEHGLYMVPTPVATSRYVVIVSPADPALLGRVNDILRAAMRDGRLEAIFRKYPGVWNDDQPVLFARLLKEADGGAAAADAATPTPSAWEMTWSFLPTLLLAAWTTLWLSCVSMALAVLMGMGIAMGRVYGGLVIRTLLAAYVEVMRGTPILLQLFVIYYGVARLVRLDAYLAALLGLGLNYAAYESEIYRAALEAIPAVQLEAARVLGLTEGQILRLVRAPQAFRLALAPMTNDFVAMLKDSSLVSVIAVPELSKQTQIFATDLASWVIPGVLCAGLYLAMSLPVSHVARRLEARWRAATL
jgi:polar amino acid transport system substrate-binding protein